MLSAGKHEEGEAQNYGAWGGGHGRGLHAVGQGTGEGAEQGGGEAVVRAAAFPIPREGARRGGWELREGLDPDFRTRET